MKDLDFIEDYFDRYRKSIFDENILSDIIKMKNMINNLKLQDKKIIVAGNGGSAAMASHVSVDYTKVGGIRTINFNESDLITCFANDYGYEKWVSKALEAYGDKGDLVVLISSSGTSKNMVNAAQAAKLLDMKVVTFSGFDKNNPLSKEGEINFWVNSKAYNIIECTHQIWLLMVCDLLFGKAEYPA